MEIDVSKESLTRVIELLEPSNNVNILNITEITERHIRFIYKNNEYPDLIESSISTILYNEYLQKLKITLI